MRSQIATSSEEYGGRRYLPYVFTVQGIAMLSAVLNSPKFYCCKNVKDELQ
ncbi:ORF6N domain-containing protein [Lachnospira pectinoschiza]|nr:ORF6N domain-containing protein [Lachnospira pectinoschiza]